METVIAWCNEIWNYVWDYVVWPNLLILIVGGCIMLVPITLIFIASGAKWCYDKMDDFVTLCPEWIQNIVDWIKKIVGAIIFVILGIFGLLLMGAYIFESCTENFNNHSYEDEDTEYYYDGHRPDHF